jgi:hypothetical protein
MSVQPETVSCKTENPIVHYRRTGKNAVRNSVSGRILAVHPEIPAPVRDLLAVLDLWCDLSETARMHLRESFHATGGRYAFVLTFPNGPSLAAEQFVLGPCCAMCVGLVAERVAEWTAEYPLASCELRPWAEVAVLRGGVWGPR